MHGDAKGLKNTNLSDLDVHFSSNFLESSSPTHAKSLSVYRIPQLLQMLESKLPLEDPFN